MTPRYIQPHKRTSDGRFMLNVGCGDRFHTAWTNIDLYASSTEVVAYNILKGLPFAEHTFDVVYHSHILEHLSRADGKTLISECFRVLKPGGILRVVLPDLAYQCRLYLSCLESLHGGDQSPIAKEHYEWAVLSLIDQMVRVRSGGEMGKFIAQSDTLNDPDFITSTCAGTTFAHLSQENSPTSKNAQSLQKRLRPSKIWKFLQKKLGSQLLGSSFLEALFRNQGEIHKWMYDSYSLGQLFQLVGFQQTHFVTAHQSNIVLWSDFYLDVDPEGNIHKPNSLFAEAIKE